MISQQVFKRKIRDFYKENKRVKMDEVWIRKDNVFYEELKAPFVAVGDAFMSLKDIGTDVVRVFKFFSEGGLTKGLKSFKNGIMALGKFFMSTKVLIGLAIAGVIAGIVYFLTSDAANSITGSSIISDGGWTAGK